MSLVDLPVPPTEEDVREAVARFAKDIAHHYGPRLRGLYLFGSRARGDHQPHSDADIAVVLDGADWHFWNEKMQLSDIAYDTVVATGVDVQGWPVRLREWRDPDEHRNPALVRAMRRDARAIMPLS